jgi:hypothetical protein
MPGYSIGDLFPCPNLSSGEDRTSPIRGNN